MGLQFRKIKIGTFSDVFTDNLVPNFLNKKRTLRKKNYIKFLAHLYMVSIILALRGGFA